MKSTGASGFPALAPPGCHWEQPPPQLGETPHDESMGETLPRSLERWGRTACRNKILYWERAFWMGCLEKGAKVVKAREQVVLSRNKHRKTDVKQRKNGAGAV